MIPYEIRIGLRYTRPGRFSKKAGARPLGPKNRFISFISGLATVGIALGVAALIVVLSVMNGFQKEVRDRMLSVLSHVEIISPERDLDRLASVEGQVLANPKVIAAAPFVSSQAMVSRDGQMRGVIVRGIDPAREPSVSDALAKLVRGRLDSLTPRGFHIVLGRELAISLNVGEGDQVVLITADGAVTPTGITPRMRQFTVTGIFSSGHFEYDSNLVLVHLNDAATLFRDQGLSGLRLRITDIQQAPMVAYDIAQTLPMDLKVRDWSYENRNWFAAVQVEKRMMFIILMLIIAVAAFNLVSMLVMTVTDKRSDIAILRTLGAQRKSIMAIFMVQGAWLGILGVSLGVLLGVVLALNIDLVMAWVEAMFGFQILPKGVYFIDQLPSDLRSGDVMQIGLTALVLSFLATIYPSWRASRLEPAEALRYE